MKAQGTIHCFISRHLPILAMLFLISGQSAWATNYRASVGTGTHHIHNTIAGSICGNPIDTSSDDAIFGIGPILLPQVPNLILLKADDQWFPDRATATGPNAGGGQSTYVSELSAVGIVTTTETGSFIDGPGYSADTVSATETIDLNTGQYTWSRTISHPGSSDCPGSWVESQYRTATLLILLTVSPLLSGVDVSTGQPGALPSTAWANAEYINDGIQFFVQDAWSGIGPYVSAAANNYPAIADSLIGVYAIGAYAVINLNNAAPQKYIPAAPPGSDQTGPLQVEAAFSALPGPVAFMAIDAEVTDLNAPRISQLDAVARYADAIWAVWTRGVPAIIYTNETYWDALTGDSQEIQGVYLWDADPNTVPKQSLAGFAPYGPWTQRLARQWTASPGVNLPSGSNPAVPPVTVDQDVFDSILFALFKPPEECKPALFVSDLVLIRNGNSLVLSGTIYNDGRAYAPLSTYPPVCDALATRINEATLLIPGSAATPGTSKGVFLSSQTPFLCNTIKAFVSSPFTITFTPPLSVPSGTEVAVRLSLSCGGLKVPARSYRLVVL